ncbi:conserved exported hypothetical protein [Hyella patelloides LEGE 07179]|uniref:Low temperature-induced protein n=1 Tax=Hyella patelloides LEGE 07179 TaxID=945734 RepID=A0A563VWN3_9CYAN|nr:hypothetical protein [Hyella patelloides]VEP15663.1 conserved exported hypothetical protein [Hyella patelloides LEGE 07179]
MLFNKLNNWLKLSVRLALTVMVCGVLFISSAYPAQATPSRTTDGEASLNRIQAKTDSVARSNPKGINEVTKESQKGLNEVQGGADKDKMVSPEDASDATTIKEQAANLLDNLTN